MMRISHTCRSRSPVTHPKTPVDSTPRPITAAAPLKRAPTHHYKSHPSYSSSSPFKGGVRRTGDLASAVQAAAVTVFAAESFNLASPKLCGQAAEQGGCPRSCGRPLCSSTSPPSAARRPATTSPLPCARSVCLTIVSTLARITKARCVVVSIDKNASCPVQQHPACRRLACMKVL